MPWKRDLHIGVAGVLCACGLGACGSGPSGSMPSIANPYASTSASNHSGTSGAVRVAQAAVPNAGVLQLSIDAGGGPSGTFVADADYGTSWSGTSATPSTIDTSRVVNPAPQSVYQTQRYASALTYTIPNLTPNAAYGVRLDFAESFFTKPGQRVFSVTINGSQVLSNFDIFAAAGGLNVAVAKDFSASADATGKIVIALRATVNNASIAGIELSQAGAPPPPQPTPTPPASQTGSPTMLCVGGTQYRTTQDDEFSQDSALKYTSDPILSTPAPNGAMWSSQAHAFAYNGTRNGVGTDDAYYTDPSRGFGGYNPFSISGGALNITAAPVPAQYASEPQLYGAHWLSGVLQAPALTYGYVEVSAKEPNLQGFWPAPLWLIGLHGADGNGNGYEELDVNELFGSALGKSVVQQTQFLDATGNPPANDVRTTVSPDPSTSYHTYGVLWTPATVQYYIDRKPTSPAYANAANGPANAIIQLEVFAPNTWALPPANGTPQTMSLQYYRWYQSQGTSCSPTVLAAAHS